MHDHPPPTVPPTVKCFGAFALDLRAGELLRDGRRVRLSPQPFKLLALLVERSGELVTREEIRLHLWGGDTFVEFDRALSFSIGQIRAALGDAAGSPRYVLTVPRRGYRFIAPVDDARPAGEATPDARPPAPTGDPRLDERLPPDRSDPRRRGPTFALTVVILAALMTGPSWPDRPADRPALTLAVLPFADDSTGDAPKTGDALSETLRTQISRMNPTRLSVATRTSTLALGAAAHDIAAVASALGADYVLEGTVFRVEDRVQVTARVIDAGEQEIWSDAYEREAGDMRLVQRELAARIAHAVDIELLHLDRDAPGAASPGRKEADAAYVQARAFFDEGDGYSLERSISLFERAIALAPDLVMAHVGLAEAHNLRAVMEAATGLDAAAPAREAATRALVLDPGRAEAHAARAVTLLYFEHEWEGARREIERALELNPGLAEAHQVHAAYLSASGHHPEALAAIDRALELNPLAPMVMTEAGFTYLFARRHERAIEVCEELAALGGSARAQFGCLEGAYLAKQDLPSILDLRRGIYEWLGASEDVFGAFASLCRQEGIRGVHQWRLLRAELAHGSSGGLSLTMAGTLAQLGRFDEALTRLDEAIRDRDAGLIYIGVWPELDPLRGDPRFAERLQAVGLPIP